MSERLPTEEEYVIFWKRFDCLADIIWQHGPESLLDPSVSATQRLRVYLEKSMEDATPPRPKGRGFRRGLV